MRNISTTGIDQDVAPTSQALYWLAGPGALSADPVTVTPVRYDLATRQEMSGAAINGVVGSQALTVTGGWVWVVVGKGSEALAEQLDPTTLNLFASHALPEVKAPYPPSPVLSATVAGPLWVAAGQEVWALDPSSGAIETQITAHGRVASMSTDPSGHFLYLVTPLSDQGGEVVSQYDARSGRLLQASNQMDAVGPGTTAATTGGVWLSYRTGNAGSAFELSSNDFKVVSSTQQGFNTFGQIGGVWSGVSEGVLWLTSGLGLTCADPDHGAIRSAEGLEVLSPVASDHVLYAEPSSGGVVAITPPPACWAPGSSIGGSS